MMALHYPELDQEGPSPAQERDHLAEQCATLLRENERLRADAIDRILEAHGRGQCEGWTDALDTTAKLLESLGLAEIGDQVRKLNPFKPPGPVPAYQQCPPAEKCATCGRTDAEYSSGDFVCSDPWHGDDHLRKRR